jgi:hypothetical protein
MQMLRFWTLCVVLFLFKIVSKRYVLNKNRTMDNVQKHNICINVPSSRNKTFVFCLHCNLRLLFLFGAKTERREGTVRQAAGISESVWWLGCRLYDWRIGVWFIYRVFSQCELRDRTGSETRPTFFEEGTDALPSDARWLRSAWPVTSSQCRGQENVDLYIHSPIRLHGVVLN